MSYNYETDFHSNEKEGDVSIDLDQHHSEDPINNDTMYSTTENEDWSMNFDLETEKVARYQTEEDWNERDQNLNVDIDDYETEETSQDTYTSPNYPLDCADGPSSSQSLVMGSYGEQTDGYQVQTTSDLPNSCGDYDAYDAGYHQLIANLEVQEQHHPISDQCHNLQIESTSLSHGIRSEFIPEVAQPKQEFQEFVPPYSEDQIPMPHYPSECHMEYEDVEMTQEHRHEGENYIQDQQEFTAQDNHIYYKNEKMPMTSMPHEEYMTDENLNEDQDQYHYTENAIQQKPQHQSSFSPMRYDNDMYSECSMDDQKDTFASQKPSMTSRSSHNHQSQNLFHEIQCQSSSTNRASSSVTTTVERVKEVFKGQNSMRNRTTPVSTRHSVPRMARVFEVPQHNSINGNQQYEPRVQSVGQNHRGKSTSGPSRPSQRLQPTGPYRLTQKSRVIISPYTKSVSSQSVTTSKALVHSIPSHTKLHFVQTSSQKIVGQKPQTPPLSINNRSVGLRSAIPAMVQKMNNAPVRNVPEVSQPNKTYERIHDVFEMKIWRNDRNAVIPRTRNLYRPPFQYTILAGLACINSPTRCITPQEVYSFVLHHFAYYRFIGQDSWKSSVRTALGDEELFLKIRTDGTDKDLTYMLKSSEAIGFSKSEMNFIKDDRRGKEFYEKMQLGQLGLPRQLFYTVVGIGCPQYAGPENSALFYHLWSLGMNFDHMEDIFRAHGAEFVGEEPMFDEPPMIYLKGNKKIAVKKIEGFGCNLEDGQKWTIDNNWKFFKNIKLYFKEQNEMKEKNVENWMTPSLVRKNF